ncbi:aspartic peptidase domain-containing protein [Yarrowia lipolytica]|jgi:hypothetical protein|uniref:YALI0C10923p n=2 Tax=Yarrowia lipolytica TaxID=4952 RepID=Q6CCB2_YARLI|nr:YALI0C10923p [Yarrowia lipolytica CLIB122]AOW02664.1 hypothetical protein YALI1_C15322g [Yarrowia lipolytica]KAB8279901.1 aspartic peptidase domain-containing protein [Yarrowia lipolytica]KAE8168890.1 aspartic peptidase domain-containing protein [Yarrowia lipolytica]KAJ8053317.1 aspartic peptidase domain-containing protein [Yarrowia lipolytica]QNP96553.1 Acid protease [Yarrowia lipolytica]|eukprot:XP_501700.2 YALI0C10923p [Yarrowia lipolytica CLIB122]
MIFSHLVLATVAAAGVVHVPLTGRALDDVPEVRDYLSKRAFPDGVVHADQIMGQVFYETYLQIGTPAQNLSFSFDTGSGNLWSPGKNSTSCEAGQCREDTMFDISASETWKFKRTGRWWGGNGIFGSETVRYAGQTLKNFEYWVSTDQMNNNFGIFGQSAFKDPSVSFVQGLAHAGKISRAVYSLNSEASITRWNLDAPKSEWRRTVNNVYYGGYDQAKYQGPLTAIDVDHYGGYKMPMSGFTVDGEFVDDGKNYTVVLDTGGLTLQVPNKTVGILAKKHGGEWSLKHDRWTIDCDAKPVLTYGFGYTQIDVEFDQFIKKAVGGPECLIQRMTFASDDQTQLLTGPPVISNALVIFDNDRNQILVAKAKYTDESNVVEITGDIPGAVQYKDFLAGKPLPGDKSAVASTLEVKATNV